MTSRVGNRSSTVDGGTTTYVPNNMNQYDSVGGVTYTYDANGNLTSDGTNSYTYDYENRLLTASKTAMSATYTYDPFGRRIQKDVNGTITNFIYDGDQIIAEYDGSGTNTAKYIYGIGLDEPILMKREGNDYYYHFNGLASVASLTNSTGQVLETYSYDVYGKPSTTSSIGNPYMFTGREYDSETGLYYYRNRYYDPRIGKFLQIDPYTWGPNDTRVYYDNSITSRIIRYIILSWGRQNPQVFNYYTFCINNPINYIDPFGLAYRQKRPLERLPRTDAWRLHHDSFRYNDGTDSGYYGDSQVHDDRSPLKSKYRRASDREFDDDLLKQAEKNVKEKWEKEPYDALEHNCQQYCDEVEKEYDRLEKEEKEKVEKPSYKKK